MNKSQIDQKRIDQVESEKSDDPIVDAELEYFEVKFNFAPGEWVYTPHKHKGLVMMCAVNQLRDKIYAVETIHAIGEGAHTRWYSEDFLTLHPDPHA